MDDHDASLLITRHLAGEATAEEEANVRAWAAAQPANARLLEDARRVWAASVRIDARWDVESAWQRTQVRLSASALDLTRRRRRRPMWPAAAGALIAASVAAVLLFMPDVVPDAEQVRVFTTSATESETVRMSDGTMVRLGPSSRLDIVGQRSVRLDGLAFFAVSEDPNAPFEVALPAGGVRVLGTRFEVRTMGDSARVTVVEGRVEVSGVETTVELTAGEATNVVRGSEPAAVSTADALHVADWMGRTLIFQNTPLSAAAMEIEAMYGVRVAVSPELGGRTLTALFTDESIERLVPTLCRAVVADCTVSDTLVTVEVQR